MDIFRLFLLGQKRLFLAGSRTVHLGHGDQNRYFKCTGPNSKVFFERKDEQRICFEKFNLENISSVLLQKCTQQTLTPAIRLTLHHFPFFHH